MPGIHIHETGLIFNTPRYERARVERTLENSGAIAQSVRKKPSTSTFYRFPELNISRSSLRRNLRRDLNKMHFKVQLI